MTLTALAAADLRLADFASAYEQFSRLLIDSDQHAWYDHNGDLSDLMWATLTDRLDEHTTQLEREASNLDPVVLDRLRGLLASAGKSHRAVAGPIESRLTLWPSQVEELEHAAHLLTVAANLVTEAGARL